MRVSARKRCCHSNSVLPCLLDSDSFLLISLQQHKSILAVALAFVATDQKELGWQGRAPTNPG